MAQDLKEKLRRFHEIDKRISFLWNKASKVQIDRLSQTDRFGPWYRECIIIAGSQREGAFFARMFLHGKHINETDCMFSVGNIQDPTNQLQSIDNAPGHFSIRFNGILECFHDGVRDKFLAEISSPDGQKRNDFLSRSTVMNMTDKMFSSTLTKTRANECLANFIFQPQEPCISEPVIFKRRGPSVLTKVVLTSAGEHLAEVQVDTVPCFKLSSWPDDLKDSGFKEFRNRKRKWPSNPEDVERIQDMVHIVPKWSPKLKEESERAECCWRLSFSEAETHLMSLFSDEEILVYLLFKILFYANIKKIKINGKKLASYFCKTTMLWMMEKEGAELCKKDILEVIRKLFGKFKQFFDEGFIPNFFCPLNNLLEGYPEDLMTECSTMAGNISQRPLDYFPSNFDYVSGHLEKVAKRLDEIKFGYIVDTIKEMKNLEGFTAIQLVTDMGRGFLHQMSRHSSRETDEEEIDLD